MEILIKAAVRPRLSQLAEALVQKKLGVAEFDFQPEEIKAGIWRIPAAVSQVIEELGMDKSLICTVVKSSAVVTQKVIVQSGRGDLELDSIALEFLKLNNSPFVVDSARGLRLDSCSTSFWELHYTNRVALNRFRSDPLVVKAAEGMIERGVITDIKILQIPVDADWYITADPEWGGFEVIREGRIWQ